MASRVDVAGQTDKELVAWANDLEEGLSDWETEFVDSLSKWLDSNPNLSHKQRAKLEQILIAKG